MNRQRYGVVVLCMMLAWGSVLVPPMRLGAAPAPDLVERDLPAYLAQLPGPLATFHEDSQTAAGIIRSSVDYYGVSVRVMLAVLEASNQLLSNPAVTAAQLQHPISTDSSVPAGFALQIDWAAAQLRAGMGPYTQAPVVRFSDGLTATINLNQAPEGVAVQRMLAVGRTKAAWVAVIRTFVSVFAAYFDDQLLTAAPPAPVAAGFLQRPWQAGVRVRHLAYFDHQFPTVDTRRSDDGVVVTYQGRRDVQYDGHDGHDYAFPDQLIGTPILAAADGTAFASTHRGNGVYIQHANGYTTVYWHLDRFSRRFAGLIDSGQGVPVSAGDVIGTSGKSGFVHGTPHLHFEVRHRGKQVDPYGWYGSGSDPCVRYPACAPSTWLWSTSLRGEFDFTPPNQQTAVAQIPQYRMVVSPRADIALLASFDDTTQPEFTTQAFAVRGTVRYVDGIHGSAVRFTPGAFAEVPTTDIDVAQGAISAWIDVSATDVGRHYLFASSAQPDEQAGYAGTIALYYEKRDDGNHAWVLWCVDDAGTRTELRVPWDGTGFHHVTATWQHATAQLSLWIDGTVVAGRDAVPLPATIGDTLSFARFPAGKTSNLLFDDIIVWRDIPTATTLRTLIDAEESPAVQVAISADADVIPIQLLPPPAITDPVVLMRVLIDGHPTEPLSLMTRFAVALPPDDVAKDERQSEIVVELTTRAGAVQRLVGVIVREQWIPLAVIRAYR